MELWGPLIDPSDENFDAVWRLLRRGLVATLVAAALAIVLRSSSGRSLGTARLCSAAGARIPLVGFIELFRGLPVVITIYYVWQVLPEIGIDVGPLPGENGLWYLVIGLTALQLGDPRRDPPGRRRRAAPGPGRGGPARSG